MALSDIGSTLEVVLAAPATYDASGWGALTGWAEVGEIASIGERGDSHEKIAVPADLKTGRVIRVKGGADGGEVSVTVRAIDYDDAGQTAVRTACDAIGAASSLSVKETDVEGNVFYYRAVFSDWKKIEASGSSYRGASFMMSVNTARLMVAAA